MSPASVTIVTQALALAEEHRGRVTLVHVLDRFPYEIIYSEAHASELIEEYRAQVATVTQELRALVPTDAPNSAEVDTEVMSGTPHYRVGAKGRLDCPRRDARESTRPHRHGLHHQRRSAWCEMSGVDRADLAGSAI
jgi:hypothetical protein